MASGPKIQWDESRSPQWRYLLQKKDPKYNSRQREKERLFKEAKSRTGTVHLEKNKQNPTKSTKKYAENVDLTDCSSKKEKINAELTTQLKKMKVNSIRRVEYNGPNRIARISIRPKE